MAEKILKFKHQIASLTLVPSSGGCFEITVNGRKIYSKLETRKFPDHEAVVKTLHGLL